MACRIAGHLFLSVQVQSNVKAYIHRRLESPEHIVILVVFILLHVVGDPVRAEVPVQVNRCHKADSGCIEFEKALRDEAGSDPELCESCLKRVQCLPGIGGIVI